MPTPQVTLPPLLQLRLWTEREMFHLLPHLITRNKSCLMCENGICLQFKTWYDTIIPAKELLERVHIVLNMGDGDFNALRTPTLIYTYKYLNISSLCHFIRDPSFFAESVHCCVCHEWKCARIIFLPGRKRQGGHTRTYVVPTQAGALHRSHGFVPENHIAAKERRS